MAVFLSYAREDKEIATQLYEELIELRGDVFMDREIKGGQDWWDAICDSVETTELFVLVVSEASIHSEACQSELTYALATQRPILPVAVGGMPLDDLPVEIKRFHVLQYDPDSKDSYREIVKALTAAGEAPPTPDPLPERPVMPESYADRYRRTIGGASIALDDQVALFAVLRSHVDDPRRRADALSLITELRARRDLAVGVAEEIDNFMAAQALLTAAAEEPEEDRPPPPAATLVVQRLKQTYLGRLAGIVLEVDGERLAEIPNGETIELQIPSGPHTVRASALFRGKTGTHSPPLELDFVPSGTLTLRVRFLGSITAGIELLRIA